ncbi:hypothetical protein REM87_28495 (plasmid) [Klebsiella pneumoniae]|nr:hypothetical protein [Klebsiella pneumoniae]WOE10340.1 hypothetical protein REM87_28495 [Klebsiella pneumoniae]
MQQTLNFDLSEQPIPVLLRGDKWDSVWSELTDNEDLNFVDASRGTSLSSLITSSVESIHTALIDGWTMMIGYSSGKDSETVLHLFLMALIRAVRSGATISQHHFILHTDTLIESPEVRWLADQKLAGAGAFHCEGKPSSDHRSSKAWDLAELDGPNPYWEGVAYVFQLHGPPV